MKAVFEGTEHSTLKCPIQNIDKLTDEPNKEYVGLYKEYDYEKNKLCLKSYYYIGYRWLNEEKEEYISISPKKHNGKQADYLAMFLECLKDPIVSKKLDDSIKIFYNEKWIETEQKEIDINPFIIFQFLKVVKKISQKGLKKGYVKVTENLTSKIKGKILVNQTIKQNHFKNRLDKTVCNHQIFTINCIENQLIKTALMQSGRHLPGVESSEISKMLKQNLNSFELVDKKEVFDSDFRTIRHSPFYKDYKEALQLAQMIFKRFGFSLNSSNEEKQTRFPPFYIDMPILFERYVEVKLREKYDDIVDGNRLEDSLAFAMRPDFLLPSENMIIDAKYKYWFENSETDKFKDDYQQLSLYGRESIIRKYIHLSDNEEAKLLFLYPKDHGVNTLENLKLEEYTSKNFNNIYKIGIIIPPSDV